MYFTTTSTPIARLLSPSSSEYRMDDTYIGIKQLSFQDEGKQWNYIHSQVNLLQSAVDFIACQKCYREETSKLQQLRVV